MATYDKDPDAVLDYGFDWSDWLESAETIATSTWTVPAGITKDSDTKDNTTTTIWLSGGTEGASYKITNHIVTSEGREDDRSHVIHMIER
jgi:hypothetical protein